MRFVILALRITAVLAAVLAPIPAPPSALAQDATRVTAAQIEHGRALFLADGCAACHGTVGQGSRVSGPRLAPHTMPLQPFVYILRHPANNMPPYVAEVLSDADARDIHAYLDSLPGPIQRVQDIPALNQ
jgi:mono/diheme cytochrome c family protein